MGCHHGIFANKAKDKGLHLSSFSSRILRLEFEDLAEFRKQLLKIVEEKGIKGVKEFSRQVKK